MTESPLINADYGAAGTARAKPDRVLPGGWYTLCFILGLTLFGFIDRQMLTLVAAPLSRDLGLSDAQLGMVLGLGFAIFSVVAVYPIAWAADRYDRRLVLAVCILTWSLGTAGCGLARTFPELMLATIAIAAGETSLDTIGLSVIPDLFTGRKRVLANSLYYFFGYLGKSLGIMLGGVAVTKLDMLHGSLPPMLQTWSSWRLAFFLVAAPAPIFIAGTMLARLRRPSPLPERSAEVGSHDTIFTLIRRHRMAYVTIFAALSAYLFSFGGFLSWLPTITTRLFGATAAENGFGIGIANMLGMMGGVATSMLLMRRLMRRMGPAASVKIAWIIAAISTPLLILFLLIGSTWHAYILLGLLMISGTAIGSLVATILQDMAPPALRTRVMALYAITSSLVGGVAPTAVGWASFAMGGSPHQLLVALILVSIPSWLLSVLFFRLSERPFRELVRDVGESG